MEDPLPGVPRIPGETDPKLAGSMVMQDGSWYLPDRVMGEFTGESPGNVNLRADRNGLGGISANRSQVIEIVCNSFSTAGKRSPSGNLYPRESALALLALTTNFTPEWTRETAIAAVTEAFDWVEANGDTNPGRILDSRQTGMIIQGSRILEKKTAVYP